MKIYGWGVDGVLFKYDEMSDFLLFKIDSLCSHPKALQQLVDKGTVAAVVSLLEAHQNDPDVGGPCILGVIFREIFLLFFDFSS